MSRAAANKTLADDANRHHVFTKGNQRELTAHDDDFVMTYECLPIAAKCHLIDQVYEQLGKSFTELDDLHGNERTVWDSRSVKR